MDVNIVTQMVGDREGKKRDGGVVEEIGGTDAEKKKHVQFAPLLRYNLSK